MEGLLLLHGVGVRAGHEVADAQLIDLTPTILASLEIALPSDMDGQVLTDAFLADRLAALPIRYQDPRSLPEAPAVKLTEQEEEGILERLRGLGYVD